MKERKSFAHLPIGMASYFPIYFKHDYFTQKMKESTIKKSHISCENLAENE